MTEQTNTKRRGISLVDRRCIGILLVLLTAFVLGGCAATKSSGLKPIGVKGEPVSQSLEGEPGALWARVTSLGNRFREDGYQVTLDPNSSIMKAIKIDESTIQYGVGKVVVQREYQVSQQGTKVSVWVHEYKLPYAKHLREARQRSLWRFEQAEYEYVPDDLLAVDKYSGLGDRLLGRNYHENSKQAKAQLIQQVLDRLK